MALNPNVPVVAPLELITATHLNAIRSNLDRLDITKLSLAGGTMTGNFIVGAAPTGAVAGAHVLPTGSMRSTIADPSATNLPNLIVHRVGAGPAVVGGIYLRFTRLATEDVIGSITIASGTSVAYNTTSDPRLKVRTGDAADAADLVRELGQLAFRGRWIDPETGEGAGDEWIMLSSHDVEDVAPYLVTGVRDAVTDTGRVDPQQVNYPGAIPLLFAALAQAIDRITTLEAAR